MSIFDKATDKLIGLKHTRIPCEQMVDMVRENFVKGANDDFLKEIKKTAKGGFLKFMICTLDSKDGRFRLIVDPMMGSFMIWIMGKEVSLVDKEEGKDYVIPSRQWKNFYKAVSRVIGNESLGRI